MVQTDPNLPGAWRNLGALLRQRGKFAEARHCTEQALKLDTNDGSLWGNYGNVLRDQGQLEESCQAFREGLKRSPGSKGLLQGWRSVSAAEGNSASDKAVDARSGAGPS